MAKKVVSFITDTTTSKRAVVYAAVAGQLREEDKWPPDDLDRVMGKPPYRYDPVTLGNFLRSVAGRMDDTLPPLIFKFDQAFITKGLTQTVSALMASIVSKSKWG